MESKYIAFIVVAIFFVGGFLFYNRKRKPKRAKRQQQQTTQPQHGADNDGHAENGGHDEHKDHSEANKFEASLWIALVIIGLFLYFGIAGFINYISDDEPIQATEKPIQPVRPTSYIEYHQVKFGAIETVKIPSGYHISCDGNGEKYYYQAEGFDKYLVGGDEPHRELKSDDVNHAYLSFYEKEVMITCTFTLVK